MTTYIRYMVINGSRKGLFMESYNKLNLGKGNIFIIDIPEESLWKLREKYPDIKAMYLYDPKDLEGKTIHDIGPILNLYDKFVMVSNDKN